MVRPNHGSKVCLGLSSGLLYVFWVLKFLYRLTPRDTFINSHLVTAVWNHWDPPSGSSPLSLSFRQLIHVNVWFYVHRIFHSSVTFIRDCFLVCVCYWLKFGDHLNLISKFQRTFLCQMIFRHGADVEYYSFLSGRFLTIFIPCITSRILEAYVSILINIRSCGVPRSFITYISPIHKQCILWVCRAVLIVRWKIRCGYWRNPSCIFRLLLFFRCVLISLFWRFHHQIHRLSLTSATFGHCYPILRHIVRFTSLLVPSTYYLFQIHNI